MATIRLSMATSLDGFVCGPDDRPGQELGQGGGRLFDWLDERGRRGRRRAGLRRGAGHRRRHHRAAHLRAGRPLGRRPPRRRPDPRPDPPPRGRRPATSTGTPPPPPAAGAARADAGDGGRAGPRHGRPPRPCYRAGELDEVEVHLVPVLLTAGRPPVRGHRGGPDRFDLELVRRLQGHDALHLRYRVIDSPRA